MLLAVKSLKKIVQEKTCKRHIETPWRIAPQTGIVRIAVQFASTWIMTAF